MNEVLYNTLRQHLQRGDAFLASGVNALIHSWQASADIIGKLCSGGDAQRWHAAIRQIQAPLNLAEILRARSSFVKSSA